MNKHNSIQTEEIDKVEELIKKSGCWEAHLRLSDCMIENSDWRKCQKEVQEFKICMTKKNFQHYNQKNQQ
ncbi:Cysteine alpha-hairpin motif superfamily domain-containing protein [Strongyloides ratti]|uniref:Cysteine alpha-hairpin motif superfamily domain-containing protein n=1 Tax=Strongyloides ratti TaxID=34506 RepID=A0A090LJS8_STRRB|nr:Cysteine alpha-hairpin motif superfamily domain-containing protein [Strongyloides ratti]CEF70067.1 Cysteine alpha-hairpin motif superfamily domain-containing protein [Strongyloides ratti]